MNHSSDIADVLNDLLDKAGLAETNDEHNFVMLKQSLEDQLAQGDKALQEQGRERSVCRSVANVWRVQ